MEDEDILKPLFSELWAVGDSQDPDRWIRKEAIEALATRLVAAGRPISAVVQAVLAAGRLLIEEREQGGSLDRQQARRLSRLVDQTAFELAVAVERGRRARRQAWLSFLVHELKNPLNTVLNALWLLRQRAGGDPKQLSRFLELAERAVKRLENRTRDVRELDEELLHPPPGWDESARAATSHVV
jgi:signal transduction histidine kinase